MELEMLCRLCLKLEDGEKREDAEDRLRRILDGLGLEWSEVRIEIKNNTGEM